MNRRNSQAAWAKRAQTIARAYDHQAERDLKAALEEARTTIHREEAAALLKIYTRPDHPLTVRDPNDEVEISMVHKYWAAYKAAKGPHPNAATAGTLEVYGGRETPTKRIAADITTQTQALTIAMDYARRWPAYTFGVTYSLDKNDENPPTWIWRWDPKQQKAIAS